MYIEKIVKGKNKVGVRLQCSCLPFSISSFFFFSFCTKSNGIQKLLQNLPKFSKKKKSSEGKHAWWRIVLCRKHHGNLFSPGQGRAWRNHMFTIPGTSVTKAHVQHPWTRYAQTWTWGENDLFHVIFSDTTSTWQIFCFSIFDRKYHKGIPPLYFFLLLCLWYLAPPKRRGTLPP